jgi:hypothetical protein
MTYLRLIICGIGAKTSMNCNNESNSNFNDLFMNDGYNITEKDLLTI